MLVNRGENGRNFLYPFIDNTLVVDVGSEVFTINENHTGNRTHTVFKVGSFGDKAATRVVEANSHAQRARVCPTRYEETTAPYSNAGGYCSCIVDEACGCSGKQCDFHSISIGSGAVEQVERISGDILTLKFSRQSILEIVAKTDNLGRLSPEGGPRREV